MKLEPKKVQTTLKSYQRNPELVILPRHMREARMDWKTELWWLTFFGICKLQEKLTIFLNCFLKIWKTTHIIKKKKSCLKLNSIDKAGTKDEIFSVIYFPSSLLPNTKSHITKGISCSWQYQSWRTLLNFCNRSWRSYLSLTYKKTKLFRTPSFSATMIEN